MSVVLARGSAAFLPRITEQVGITNSLEAAIDFWEWAQQHQTELTAAAIRERYQCSRASAYRYLSAYRAICDRRAAREAA